MTLSMLQDAQTLRGLEAAIANMKHEEDIRMSVSPPTMSSDTAAMYSRLFASGNFPMLGPQFMASAANRSAAAFMASQIPIPMRASLAAASAATNYFPTNPSLFGFWPMQHSAGASNPASPPISPISPSLSVKSVRKINNNNNNIVSTTTDILTSSKKPAKQKSRISVKKELMTPPSSLTNTSSHPMDIPMSMQQHQHELLGQGPISPPTSGSSPQSIGSVDHPSPALLPNAPKDPSRDKVFTCKTCSRSFGYKHVLQNHERTHTGEKPFKCPECNKRFTRDHHLKTHMRLHTGEKPYHCSHCDRQFVQVANLRRHLRVHTGERPYTCEICKSKFSDSNQLKAHMLIHNGEKPFQCELCQTRFRRRHHLVHHRCGANAGLNVQIPAMSPAMSLSASSRSDTSEMSLDLSKSSSLHQYSMQSPLDLSEDGPELEKRNRKSHDVRRILRMPSHINHIMPTTILPVQTEPEDLSMHSPRSNISHDDDLDDLDDAASLYHKHGRSQKQLHYSELHHASSPLPLKIEHHC